MKLQVKGEKKSQAESRPRFVSEITDCVGFFTDIREMSPQYCRDLTYCNHSIGLLLLTVCILVVDKLDASLYHSIELSYTVVRLRLSVVLVVCLRLLYSSHFTSQCPLATAGPVCSCCLSWQHKPKINKMPCYRRENRAMPI